MELEQPILGNHAIFMTFDEVYMERSMGFVKALQELKNLRPQLFSASEYCEKTYLQNEQKHMVLDNIKDYAVRALVNAVDHLGTVAYKLTELMEQQSIDVSNVELKVSCLSQVIRHQRLFSWHLASEAKPTLKGATIHAGTGSVNENENIPTKAAGVFHLVVDNGESSSPQLIASSRMDCRLREHIDSHWVLLLTRTHLKLVTDSGLDLTTQSEEKAPEFQFVARAFYLHSLSNRKHPRYGSVLSCDFLL